MHGNRKAAGLLYRTKGSLRKTAHECCLPRARVVQAERCQNSYTTMCFHKPPLKSQGSDTKTSTQHALKIVCCTHSNIYNVTHDVRNGWGGVGWCCIPSVPSPRCISTNRQRGSSECCIINGSITPVWHLIANTWRSNHSIPKHTHSFCVWSQLPFIPAKQRWTIRWFQFSVNALKNTLKYCIEVYRCMCYKTALLMGVLFFPRSVFQQYIDLWDLTCITAFLTTPLTPP